MVKVGRLCLITGTTCCRIHLNWFCHLNKFLSPSFGDCNYSCVVKQSDIRFMYVVIRSMYVLYDNMIYIRTLWQYLLCRNVPAMKLSGFQPSGSEMLDIWNFKMLIKSVKKYIWFKFETVDLYKQPRGIQKCNKMGVFFESQVQNSFWIRSLINRYFGGDTFYSIENSIDLMGTCLKILQCPMYVHNKTSTLLLITLLPCYYCGVNFCHTMTLAAAGSYRHHCHSVAQSKHKDFI
jgi:hypothetical protein